MKRKYVDLLAMLAICTMSSCSKNGGGSGGGGYNPPPDPGETGTVQATLSFSSGSILALNATGNYTLFTRRIDAAHGDTLIVLSGSLPDATGQLTIRLTNIDMPGTYPFVSRNVPPPSSGYALCEFLDYSHAIFYSTQQVVGNSGSITVQSLNSSSISATFNAVVSNWYPGTTDPVITIAITNGSLGGNFKTYYY